MSRKTQPYKKAGNNIEHSTSALRKMMQSLLAEQLDRDVDSIDIHTSFSRHGLDSIGATTLIARLSADLGRELPVTLVWSHPNVDALARYLEDQRPNVKHNPVDSGHRHESIAITGIGCRFPRNARTPEEYWKMIREGKDAISEIPSERWDAAAFYDPNLRASGKMNARRGGFLDRVDGFEPQFFGISPREAMEMDPQQRLMLELSWESLENAGIVPAALMGSDTGVFCGMMNNDYELLLAGRGINGIDAHTSSGSAHCIASNRVSYILGVHGPSMTLHTACSSSLVAVHLACQAIRNGECQIALAGGVQLMLSPYTMVLASKFGALSPDGRCHTFDARANGYVRGEGGGVVTLEPLSRALIEGRRVYGVIRSSAINNDGPSNGLTAPNPNAQISLIRSALARGGVDPASVQYVELHGTGTALGDPIEASALGEVYGKGRPGDQPVLVGSVKTNIGHLEAAAGIAGLIKAALCVYHQEIPPSLNFETPNPHIDFERHRLEVVKQRRAWPRNGSVSPRAGVSSFGFGGTNAHLLLEGIEQQKTLTLPLAADSKDTLHRRVRTVRDWLGQVDERDWKESVCDLAARCSNRGDWRMAVTGRSRMDFAAALDSFVNGQENENLVASKRTASPLRPVFVFSGFGHQWFGMGRQLYAREAIFRTALRDCDRAFQETSGWSLLNELFSSEIETLQNDPNAPHVVQPLLLALQIATASLWRSWGIEPSVVIGHSIGEIAAAHVSGILDLPATMRLAHSLGMCCRRCVVESGGRFVFVACEERELDDFCRSSKGEVHIAGYNAPGMFLISGDTNAIRRMIGTFEKRDIYYSILWEGDGHCERVGPFVRNLPREVGDLNPRAAQIPMFSTVEKREVNGFELNTDYWARNIQSPVLFSQSLNHLIKAGFTTFLEISAHTIMAKSVKKTLHHLGEEGSFFPSQSQEENGHSTALRSLGGLYTLGADVSWKRVFPLRKGPTNNVPGPADERNHENEDMLCLLPLSARSESSLVKVVEQYRDFLRETDEPLANICASLSLQRSHHEYRLCAVSSSHDGMLGALDAHLEGSTSPLVVRGHASQRDQIVFAFSGHGAPWIRLGRDLLDIQPAFRRALEECDRIFTNVTETSVVTRLQARNGDSHLDQEVSLDPCIFAVQFALAQLWRSWGMEPVAALGQGIGEVTAATVSGALSLEEGARAVCDRSQSIHLQRSKIPLSFTGDFGVTVQELTNKGYSTFLEISPHPILTPAIERELSRLGRMNGVCIPTINENHGANLSLLLALGRLHAIGFPIDFKRQYPLGAPIVSHPPHPWCWERYWFSETSADQNAARQIRPREQEPHRLRTRLRTAIAEILEVTPDSLDPERSLNEYGLDSLFTAEIIERLNDDLGTRVPTSLLVRGPSLDEIHRAVMDQLGRTAEPKKPTATIGGSDTGLVVHLPRPTAKLRLFCFAYAAGGAAAFRGWPKHLPDSVEVCAIQPPGRETRIDEPLIDNFNHFLEESFGCIQSHLALPFALFGYSLGGLVAFECARMLRRTGMPAPLSLFVGASPSPDLKIDKISGLADDALLEHLKAMGGTSFEIFDNPELREMAIRILRADLAVRESYVYRKEEQLACPIVVYGGTDDDYVRPRDLDRWSQHTSARFDRRMLTGGHFFVDGNREIFFGELSKRLNSWLAFNTSDNSNLDHNGLVFSPQQRRKNV